MQQTLKLSSENWIKQKQSEAKIILIITFPDQCEEDESVDFSVRRRIRTNYDRKESSTHQGGGYFYSENDPMTDNQQRRLRSSNNRDAP